VPATTPLSALHSTNGAVSIQKKNAGKHAHISACCTAALMIGSFETT
jgi:hypothetical protein